MRDGLFRQNQFQIKCEIGSVSAEVLKSFRHYRFFIA